MDDDNIFDNPLGQEVLRHVKRNLRAELEENQQREEESRKAKVQPIRPDIIPRHDENFTFDSKSWGEILTTDYPEIRWIIPGLIPEGLTVISGPPKIGKSWLAMNLGIAVAGGGIAIGKIPVAQGKVLYLALEDSERRIKQRMQAILGKMGQTPVIGDALHFVTLCAKLDNGLVDALQNFLKSHEGVVMVVIDTLAKVRPSKRPNGKTTYETDYSELSLLQAICNEHGISIVVITHNRKLSSEDVLEDISGSMGISGSADTLLVIKRARGSKEATIFVTGRDIEQEETYAMTFDESVMSWCITGEGLEVTLSQEKQDLLDVLREHGGQSSADLARIMPGEEGQTPRRRAKTLNKNLNELLQLGLVEKHGHAFFARPKT